MASQPGHIRILAACRWASGLTHPPLRAETVDRLRPILSPCGCFVEALEGAAGDVTLRARIEDNVLHVTWTSPGYEGVWSRALPIGLQRRAAAASEQTRAGFPPS